MLLLAPCLKLNIPMHSIDQRTSGWWGMGHFPAANCSALCQLPPAETCTEWVGGRQLCLLGLEGAGGFSLRAGWMEAGRQDGRSIWRGRTGSRACFSGGGLRPHRPLLPGSSSPPRLRSHPAWQLSPPSGICCGLLDLLHWSVVLFKREARQGLPWPLQTSCMLGV